MMSSEDRAFSWGVDCYCAGFARDTNPYTNLTEKTKKLREAWFLGWDMAEQLEDKCPREAPRHPMFRDHNCWKCREGEHPCVVGNPRQCEYPHAHND